MALRRPTPTGMTRRPMTIVRALPTPPAMIETTPRTARGLGLGLGLGVAAWSVLITAGFRLFA